MNIENSADKSEEKPESEKDTKFQNIDSEKQNNLTDKELQTKKARERWMIFHMLNFMVAFLANFFNPMFASMIERETFGEIYTGIIGLFCLYMALPWLISIVNRLFTKKFSSPKLFIFYYIIFFCWIFYNVSLSINIYKHFGNNPLDKFQDYYFQGWFKGAFILTFLIFGLIFYVHWIAHYKGKTK